MTPFHWLPEQVAAIRPETMPVAPAFGREAVGDVLPGYDVWDHWPLLTSDGALAEIGGGLLVFALTAPAAGDADPDARHAIARLRLFHRTGGVWRDLGLVFADNEAPGSRQWSGSAILDDAGVARLFFTAVGARGEAIPSVGQFLFETQATLRVVDGLPRLEGWSPPVECVRPDGVDYATDMTGGGAIGTIKAFRDPYFFRAGGDDWLLFAASDAQTSSAWNGAIGAARLAGGEWTLAPPLVLAANVSNELERPHAITHSGAVYLFWSTQASVFAADGPRGPTGLYGVTADRWGAPWRAINASGLVFANPEAAPIQAYSFQVLPDLSVWSFADMPGLRESPTDAVARRAAFAGGPAPVLRLTLDGANAALQVK